MAPLPRKRAAKAFPKPAPSDELDDGDGESSGTETMQEKEKPPLDYLAELAKVGKEPPQCDDCDQIFGDFEKDLLPERRELIVWRTFDEKRRRPEVHPTWKAVLQVLGHQAARIQNKERKADDQRGGHKDLGG